MVDDRLGFNFRTNIDFMTPAEREVFKRLRRQGEISFFRTAKCKRCDNEILKGKLFCSEECAMLETFNVESVAKGLIGQRIELETKDGSARRGRLTDITWSTLLVDDKEVRWPHGVILNGDKIDEIPWGQLAWIKKSA